MTTEYKVQEHYSVVSDTGHFAIIPEWVLFHKELSAPAVRVYAVLASHADRKNGNKTWPSRKTIAAEANCSVPTSDRAIAELAKCGAIKRHQRVRKDGSQTSNLYTVIRKPPLMAPRGEIAEPPLIVDDQPMNQNHVEPDTEPPRQSEIDSSSPPPMALAASPADFYAAEAINDQVALLVDIAKQNGRMVRGGRVAAILKRHENKTAVMVAFMDAIARNVAVIEDYTEGVLANGQGVQESRRRDQPLGADRGASSPGELFQEKHTAITEEEAYRAIRERKASARAAGEGRGGPGPEALAED